MCPNATPPPPAPFNGVAVCERVTAGARARARRTARHWQASRAPSRVGIWKPRALRRARRAKRPHFTRARRTSQRSCASSSRNGKTGAVSATHCTSARRDRTGRCRGAWRWCTSRPSFGKRATCAWFGVCAAVRSFRARPVLSPPHHRLAQLQALFEGERGPQDNTGHVHNEKVVPGLARRLRAALFC